MLVERESTRIHTRTPPPLILITPNTRPKHHQCKEQETEEGGGGSGDIIYINTDAASTGTSSSCRRRPFWLQNNELRKLSRISLMSNTQLSVGTTTVVCLFVCLF